MNPKTPKEIDEYLDWCEQGGAVPRFKGHPPFEYLLKIGRIAPYYTTIRIMYSGLLDQGYWVNEEGLLEQICGGENPLPLNPKEVLSIEKHPDGWEPENLRPAKK